MLIPVADSDGWSYLRVPDPGRGEFRLLRVTRSDGLVIPIGTNVWTTDRTFVGNGRKPRAENVLHLLDHGGPGRYRLDYQTLAPLESLPPTSRIALLPAESFPLIPLQWSGEDNPGGSGIAGFDIFVSIRGGPFQLWLQQTPNLGAYVGQLGERYAFKSIAVDHLGNRQPMTDTADALTTVTHRKPRSQLAAIPNASIDQGDVLVIEPVATIPTATSFPGVSWAPHPPGPRSILRPDKSLG